MYKVSICNSNVNCQTKDVTFSDLQKLITTSDWSPIVFKDNYRKGENFLSTDLIVLDVDDGVSLKQAAVRLINHSFIIAPTRSHQQDKNGKCCDRFRVILFLEKTITDPEEYKATWKKVSELFPECDQSCKDTARFYYSSIFVSHSRDNGQLVKVSQPAHKSPNNTVAQKANMQTNESGLSKSTLILMAMGAPKGKRNDALFKAAKDAQAHGFDESWCLEKLASKIISTDFPIQEAEQTIKSAFKNLPVSRPGNQYLNRLRDQIIAGTIIRNIEDQRETFLINDNSNTRLSINMGTVFDTISKEDMEYMRRSGKYVNAMITYNPEEAKSIYVDENGTPCFNKYQPPTWYKDIYWGNADRDKSIQLPQIYIDFFNHLTNGDQSSFDFLVDWLAKMVTGRNLTILTTIGEQGIGKGILGEIMQALVGDTNYIKCRDTVLKTKFNGHIEGKRLVYIDELDIKHNKAAHDRIKDLVNPQIELEQKGKDPRFIKNYASIYLSSNSWDAVRIEAGNRRYSVIELTNVKITNTPLEPRIDTEILNPQNISLLGQYLLNHEIKFDLKTPFHNSERYNEVMMESIFEWEDYILNEWAPDHQGRTYSINEIKNAIKRHFKGNFRAPGRRKIEDLAKKFPEILKFRQDGSNRSIYVQFPKNPEEMRKEAEQLMKTEAWNRQYGHIDGMKEE
ncbi:MAG: hypothetical protein KDD58_04650 [Bdellovibrionales bacterium]|nr:hypothetical protein [Bdellovibrionales bacterium]